MNRRRPAARRPYASGRRTLDNPIGEFQAGIWGGTTPKERQELVVAELTRKATA
jgi:hypothetical protein